MSSGNIIENFFNRKNNNYNITGSSMIDSIIRNKLATLKPNAIDYIAEDNLLLLQNLSFDSFVGQEDVTDMLRVAVMSAKKQNKPISHILLYGQPGLGKSLLARTVAAEMKAYYKEFLGSELKGKSKIELVIQFLKLDIDNKVMMIDEIHNIPSEISEYLYEAMQNFSIKSEPIKPFTLIAATTSAGDINRPLRERFTYTLKLGLYSIEEIALMLQDKYSNFDDEMALFVAKRSKGIPRIAMHLGKIINDTAVYDSEEPAIKHAIFVMEILSINEDGLTKDDMGVLNLLRSSSSALSKSAICSILRIDQSDYDWIIEPTLLSMNLMIITKAGRVLTDRGRSYLLRNR